MNPIALTILIICGLAVLALAVGGIMAAAHHGDEIISEHFKDKAQKIVVENAVDDNWVVLRAAHVFPLPQDAIALGVDPKQFYHVVAGNYQVGSTITTETALAHGLRVEIVE
jgi:hypothetical protein